MRILALCLLLSGCVQGAPPGDDAGADAQVCWTADHCHDTTDATAIAGRGKGAWGIGEGAPVWALLRLQRPAKR